MRKTNWELVALFCSILIMYSIATPFVLKMVDRGRKIMNSDNIHGPSFIEKKESEEKNVVVIHLKSGGKLKGILIDTSKERIIANVGYGEVSLAVNDIEKIVYPSDQKQTALLNKAWEDQAVKATDKEKMLNEKIFKERVIENIKLVEETASMRFGTTVIPFRNESQIIIKARLDNKIDVSLLFDTGASWVYLSKDIAEKLMIDLWGKKTVPLLLADNSTTTGVPILLGSVKVGDVEANNVRAAVMLADNKSLHGFDGLLGMSFLKNFLIKLDNQNKTLTLEHKKGQGIN